MRSLVVGLAVLCLACSGSSPDQSGISQSDADALSEALTLEPGEVGTDFADYTSGLSEEVDLAECTPGIAVVAQAPARSYGTSLGDSDPAEVVDQVEDMKQIVVKSLVYGSTDDARSAFAVLGDQLSSESAEDRNCLDGAGDQAQFEVADDSVASVDESVVLSAEQGPTMVLVRNGPTVSLLVPVFGSMEVNRSLIDNVASKLATVVADET